MNNEPAQGKNGRGKKRPVKEINDTWDLHLYIAGQTPKAVRALKNLQLLCEEELKGKYHIRIIDLLRKPQLARDNQILAIPTLIRKLPLPVRNIIGDLSNKERVLIGLDLIARTPPKTVPDEHVA